MDKIECYIEEYINDNFKLCARLRDKKTNKHVILEINNIMDKNKFLNFLSQAKIHQNIMPTIFDKNGKDFVEVSGKIINNTSDFIEISINNNGGYVFK